MELKSYSKTSTVTPAMEDYARTKLEKKLSRFISDEPAKLTMETRKKEIVLKVQVVLNNNKHIRCEIVGKDYYRAVDKAVANLLEQAKSVKEKLSRKDRIERVETPVEEIPEPCIKKVKRFTLERVTEGIAMMEMEKLGHDSYIFKNLNEDDKICVLYKRFDDDYSMIVIEN